MKKIFWTSLFWLALIALFGSYMKFFNTDLATTFSALFVKDLPMIEEVAFTGETLSTPVFDNLTAIDTEMVIIADTVIDLKLQEEELTSSQLTSTSASTVIKLYYFNEKEDKMLPAEQQASAASLVPVIRTVPQTDNIIRDAITMLIQGGLTDEEFKNGFTSDFVRVVRLEDSSLSPDGTLDLTFSKTPGANIGGSAFITILTNSIAKTALQFPQVKSINLLPEELFQP